MQDLMTEEKYVEVPGGRIFVRQWTPAASTNQPPIVLLHDSLGCVELWRDFPAQLAQRLCRRVIGYDRLGYGQSSERRELPSLSFIDDEAKIIFPALCRALGQERVIPFGHSVGGSMAIAIASIHTEADLCASVITESAQAFVEDRTKEGIAAAKQYFSDSRQLEKLTEYHGSKARWVLEAWTEIWLDPRFWAWSLRSHLEQVQCPVLAIHGDKDEYGSTAFPNLIAEIVSGYSRAVILEGFGHVPHRQNPDAILDAVSAFLLKVEDVKIVADST